MGKRGFQPGTRKGIPSPHRGKGAWLAWLRGRVNHIGSSDGDEEFFCSAECFNENVDGSGPYEDDEYEEDDHL
jgi:hypothetical protein